MSSSSDHSGRGDEEGKEQQQFQQVPSLLNLPLVVSTGRILPFAESSDLLSFRVVSTGFYRLVHGGRRRGRSSSGGAVAGGAAATCSAAAAGGPEDFDSPRPSAHDALDDDTTCTSSKKRKLGGEAEAEEEEEGNYDDDEDDEDGLEAAENLWRLILGRDFGFCYNWDVRCGNPDGTLKGNMHLRTFRDPDEAAATSSYGEQAFLRTDQEMIAGDAFESWKRWERLRLRFDKEARSSARSDIPYGEYGAFTVPPRADETFFIVGPFFLRCADTWRTIETWCNDSRASGSVGQYVLRSLLPGRALPLSRTTLRYEPYDPEFQPVGLESLLALYAFYIGQGGERLIDPQSFAAGLLGSYSAYQHFASTRLCVLSPCTDGRRCIVAESSVSLNHPPLVPHKVFTLDLTGGGVCVPPELRQDDEGRYITSYRKATPQSTITPGLSRDSIIVWLNEYANRLENGMYSVGKIRPNDAGSAATAILLYPTLNGSATTITTDATKAKAILLYPTLNGAATTVVGDAMGEPHTASRPSSRVSRCVTRGVEVVASAVHAHEINSAMYSIRIRIVQPGEEGYLSPSDRGFDCCQLRSRRWILTSAETAEEEHVSGEGVIGFFPLLLDNGGHYPCHGWDAAHVSLFEEREEETFVYQSMSNVYEGGGTMSGTLQFVPGNLSGPTGPEFDVVVESFPLPKFVDGDQYIY